LGVVVAVQQWQPSKGASLDTYARHKMNGYIQHGFRDRTWQKNCKPLPRELVSLDVLIADEY
jgi:DNA-directed RNA polymerase specialized sigma subunit